MNRLTRLTALLLVVLLILLSLSCAFRKYKSKRPGTKHETLGITLASIPGGTFRMGVAGGGYFEHTVTLDGFKMSATEITQGQYKSVMGENPSDFIGNNLPVETVSWYDAVKFCNRLSDKAGLERCYSESTFECDFSRSGFRLPTEAEWEYACRAGTETMFYTGNNISSDDTTSTDLDRAGWYYGNSNKQTHPAGQKEPNAFGLYDMHGNVWEWCNDWYNRGYYTNSPIKNPCGPSPSSARVLRGGSWFYNASYCHSAFRNRTPPSNTSYNLGFRVVRRP